MVPILQKLSVQKCSDSFRWPRLLLKMNRSNSKTEHSFCARSTVLVNDDTFNQFGGRLRKMHLRRRGSLTPSIESDPKFPPPAIESDPKARFRMGMLGGNKAFSASVDIIQTAGPAGAAEHSFNGEDETMQVN